MRKLTWNEIFAAPLLVHSRPMAFIEHPGLIIVVFLEISVILSAGGGFRQGWNQGGLIGAVDVALLGACVGAIAGILAGSMFAATVWLIATTLHGADRRKTTEIIGESRDSELTNNDIPVSWSRTAGDGAIRSDPSESPGPRPTGS